MVVLNQQVIGDDHNGGKGTQNVVFVYTWYQGKIRVGCVAAPPYDDYCCCNLVRIDGQGELRLSQLATCTFSKEEMRYLRREGAVSQEQYDGRFVTYRLVSPETDIVLEIMRLARKDERASQEA